MMSTITETRKAEDLMTEDEIINGIGGEAPRKVLGAQGPSRFRGAMGALAAALASLHAPSAIYRSPTLRRIDRQRGATKRIGRRERRKRTARARTLYQSRLTARRAYFKTLEEIDRQTWPWRKRLDKNGNKVRF
jgi:hypothetical protein